MIIYTLCFQEVSMVCDSSINPGHLCCIKLFTSVDELKLFIFKHVDEWKFHADDHINCDLIKIKIDDCIKKLRAGVSTHEVYEPKHKFEHFISILKSEIY